MKLFQFTDMANDTAAGYRRATISIISRARLVNYPERRRRNLKEQNKMRLLRDKTIKKDRMKARPDSR